MLSLKALKNIEKTKRWAKSTPKSEPDRIVECDENSQVFNWQRTNKKSQLIPKKEFERELKTHVYKRKKT